MTVLVRCGLRSRAIRPILNSPTVSLPAERRQAIVENLLGGKASPITVNLVSFVVGAGRARDLPAIIDRVVERAAAERKHVVAEVRSAVPLDAKRQEKLAKALSKNLGLDVEVKVIVDPSVIGGAAVFDRRHRHRRHRASPARSTQRRAVDVKEGPYMTDTFNLDAKDIAAALRTALEGYEPSLEKRSRAATHQQTSIATHQSQGRLASNARFPRRPRVLPLRSASSSTMGVDLAEFRSRGRRPGISIAN